ISAHVSAASGLSPLASEFYPGRSTFADATAHLVVRPAGRVSGALRSATTESRSTADDFVLVHQQLVRSSDQRRPDSLSRWPTNSLQEPSRRGHFLSLRSNHRSVFVLVSRRGVCGMESLGPGRLLEADPALLFLPLPFLLWAAVRFGSLGASSAISIVGFLAIWSGSHGHGPFSGGTAEQNALSIQIFLIALAIPLMFLAAVIEERTKGQGQLRESEERMSLAADAANLGLWIWNIPGDDLRVTEKWRKLFGFADSERVTFARLLQVVHPGDRERMKQLVQHMFEHGGEY